MEALAQGQVALKMHGTRRPTGTSERVPAATFAHKLILLVRALKAADRAVNDGTQTHDYTIATLKTSSPLAILQEEPIVRRRRVLYGASGTEAFDACLAAINAGNTDLVDRYGKCPEYISKLAEGSGRQFGYGELWVNQQHLVRVDSLLVEQAKAVARSPSIAKPAQQKWFKGTVRGTFDGYVKEVDLRGALPEVKLVLTGTTQEIDCILRGFEVEQIREVLNRRVRVEGDVLYDGRSGLPRRISVNSIKPAREDVDFSKWRGAFEPFVSEWSNEQ